MENYRPWFMRRLRSGNRVALGTTAAGLCVGVLLVLGFARASFGDPTQFTLNTAQSTLKLSGRVGTPLGTTVAMQPQVTGSDTATYSGFLLANLSAGGIQFPGGSNVAANNFVGPTLMPDNPANYGMKATILFTTANATVINLVFDLGSGALAVAADGTFPANMGTTATVTSGVIDYTTSSGPGSGSLKDSMASNQASTSATLSIVGQTQTLTIPINATIPFSASNPNDSTAIFTGKLVATNTLTTPTTAYWRGDLDASWSTMQPTAATNWRKDVAGANETLGLPGATTDAFFTTSGGGSNLSTVLGANYSIKGAHLHLGRDFSRLDRRRQYIDARRRRRDFAERRRGGGDQLPRRARVEPDLDCEQLESAHGRRQLLAGEQHSDQIGRRRRRAQRSTEFWQQFRRERQRRRAPLQRDGECRLGRIGSFRARYVRRRGGIGQFRLGAERWNARRQRDQR